MIFDTATGRRLYRTVIDRTWTHLFRKASAMWLLEVVGVGMIALGAAMVFPAAGVVIIGVYAVLAANVLS